MCTELNVWFTQIKFEFKFMITSLPLLFFVFQECIEGEYLATHNGASVPGCPGCS